MDGLAKNGLHAFLATPSGAKPRWMSEKYPEVRRIDTQGRRLPHGDRHNHCFTSPVYREKARAIDARLAERYGKHEALAGWHISNEFSGSCYCELCLAAFREWLKARHGSLERLNHAYWTAFWSQAFQDWSQIDPRETPLDGLLLDWDRFVTHQTVDFMKNEMAPLKAATPQLPVTTNLMGVFSGLDYRRFAEVCDRMAWDSYPHLHGERLVEAGAGPLVRARSLPVDEGRAPVHPHGVDAQPDQLVPHAAAQEARPASPGDAARDRPRRRLRRCTSSGARARAASRSSTAPWWTTRAAAAAACSGTSPRWAPTCSGWTRSWAPPCGPRSRSSTTGRSAGRSHARRGRGRARATGSAASTRST